MISKKRLPTTIGAILAFAIWNPAAQATPISITYSGSSTTWTVPSSGIYEIIAYGAQGGSGSQSSSGGKGAEIGGEFALTAGTVLDIAVGGAGVNGIDGGGGGGGGGTFVTFAGTTTNTSGILVIAGGGGGGALATGIDGNTSTSGGSSGIGGASVGVGGVGGSGGGALFVGGGGGGFLGNGSNASLSGNGGGGFPTLSGGVGFGFGGGGFGGGGGASSDKGSAAAAGGGGGYSGGGGGDRGAGGGGSFLSNLATNPIILAGIRSGDGLVTIEALSSTPTVPEPTSLSLLAIGAAALGVRRSKKMRQGHRCAGR